MAKQKMQVSGKGVLDINWDSGTATITTNTKDSEYVYDFFKILEGYNGKQIFFSITEESELPTLNSNTEGGNDGY